MEDVEIQNLSVNTICKWGRKIHSFIHKTFSFSAYDTTQKIKKIHKQAPGPSVSWLFSFLPSLV
jgi:hypothetical protein